MWRAGWVLSRTVDETRRNEARRGEPRGRSGHYGDFEAERQAGECFIGGVCSRGREAREVDGVGLGYWLDARVRGREGFGPRARRGRFRSVRRSKRRRLGEVMPPSRGERERWGGGRRGGASRRQDRARHPCR